jgi:hypothetical protein
VLEIACRPAGTWPGHQSGQCVLADFGPAGRAPIPSPWPAPEPRGRPHHPRHQALGDYTRSLPGRVAVGQTIRLEGPYGGFTFDAAHGEDSQVWVAGGIGITPSWPGCRSWPPGAAPGHRWISSTALRMPGRAFRQPAGPVRRRRGAPAPPPHPATRPAARRRGGRLPQARPHRMVLRPGRVGRKPRRAPHHSRPAQPAGFHRELFEFR